MARTLVLLVALASLALPGAAGATTLGTVVRGAGAGADKAAGHIAYYLRYALTEDGRYDVVPTTLGSNDAAQAQKAFGEADDLVKKAQEAYETLDLDPAVEYLRSALTGKYERNAAHVTNVRRVAELLTLLGAVHILRGEDKLGAERLAQAVTIDPKVEPDPRVFNPAMREIFQQAVEHLSARPRGSLAISSNPSYAEVYVDGVFRGVTPLLVDGLSEGKHYVRLVKDGYRSFGAIENIAAGKESSTNGALRAAPKLDDYDKLVASAMEESHVRDGMPGSVGPSTKKLAALLGVEHLFLAEVRLDGERVKLLATQLDVAQGKHLKTASHVFSYDTRLDTYENEIHGLLKRQFGETTLSKPASTIIEAAPAGDVAKVTPGGDGVTTQVGTAECMGFPCQRFKLMALIGGGGLGIVLGGVGGLLDYLAVRDRNEYLVTPQTSPKSKALRDGGEQKALIGDVLVGLGILSAAAGAGIYLFYGPSTYDTAASTSGATVGVQVLPLQGGGLLSGEVRF